MSKKNTGLAWHCHHRKLIEPCHDFAGRVDFITTNKPAKERKARLRLFAFVKGKLPEELVIAAQKLVRATKAENGAWRGYIHGQKARSSWANARNRLGLVQDSFDVLLKKHKAKVKKLHDKECQNCPWDGETIFPK